MRATWILTGVLSCVLSLPASAQEGQSPRIVASIAPVFEKDLVYSQLDGVDLKLDFARPAGDGPYPCVVCFHGGGFQLGNRAELHPMLTLLVRHGFAAATVTYRLAPRHKLPAAYEDARCAVRFVRANASRLKIDSSRVAVLGASAGGVIGLVAGLANPRDGFDGQGHEGQTNGVQAIVNFFGPTDFATLKPTAEGEGQIRQAYGKPFEQVLADALGTSDRTDKVFRRLSPINYVRPGAPPVLTLHGTVDPLVGLEQAKTLHAALKKAGVAEELVVVEQGGHGWGGADLERTNRAVIDFLEQRLQKPTPVTAKDNKDGKSDAKARAIVDEFSKALLAKDADGVLKLVSAPFALAEGGKLEVVRDLATVRELVRKGLTADVPAGTQFETERIFTYQAFVENLADQIKDADRKQLDGVAQKDDRVVVVQVKDGSGSPAKRLILVVGWRDGQPRLVGIGG